MKMKKYLTLLLIAFIGISNTGISVCQKIEKSKISFSFDDGSISDFPKYPLEDWNQLLIDNLNKHNVKALFFVKGINLDNEKGSEIISSWNNAGHLIGNHTYNHPYFNSERTSLEQFKWELLKNDSLINGYSNFTKLFRFPYLKEGSTIQKREGFRAFLKEQGYKNGHVTIDASDWYIDGRLVKRLNENPDADLLEFKKYYIEHIYDRALFYDSLAFELTGRRVNHNLLLHHNLAAALFLDDLIRHFKNEGWDIVDVDKAYKDDIYKKEPNNIPAGESLFWALAKQSGNFDDILRYPAEDSRYEKDKMDKLGL